MSKEKKKYSLGEKFNGAYLSQRQAECMTCLIYGKTMRKTAERLGLSVRTVEYYVDNIREKLDCNNKCILIEGVLASDFRQTADKIIKDLFG